MGSHYKSVKEMETHDQNVEENQIKRYTSHFYHIVILLFSNIYGFFNCMEILFFYL